MRGVRRCWGSIRWLRQRHNKDVNLDEPRTVAAVDPGGSSVGSSVHTQVAPSGYQYDVAEVQCGSQAVECHPELAGQDEQDLLAGRSVSHTL